MSDLPLIAIVDDDEIAQTFTEETLRNHGVATACFSSGPEFLAALDSLPDLRLILLDMQMPGMSGHELQCHLEEMGVRIPIVFLSGTLDVTLAFSMFRHGAAEVLCKPPDTTRLLRIVDDILAAAPASR